MTQQVPSSPNAHSGIIRRSRSAASSTFSFRAFSKSSPSPGLENRLTVVFSSMRHPLPHLQYGIEARRLPEPGGGRGFERRRLARGAGRHFLTRDVLGVRERECPPRTARGTRRLLGRPEAFQAPVALVGLLPVEREADRAVRA